MSHIELPLFPTHANCTLCELHNGRTHVGIPTIYVLGSLDPSPSTRALVMIGQNPGYEEDKEGIPFIGPSGKLVRGSGNIPGPYLDGYRFRTLASCYLTNTARCLHTSDKFKDKWADACYNHTLTDLEAIASLHTSTTVLTLGGLATATLHHHLNPDPALTRKGAFKWAMSHPAHTLTLPSGKEITTFATFHPAAILRESSLMKAVDDHLRTLHTYFTGTLNPTSAPHIIPPCPPPRTLRRPPCHCAPSSSTPTSTAPSPVPP